MDEITIKTIINKQKFQNIEDLIKQEHKPYQIFKKIKQQKKEGGDDQGGGMGGGF